MALASIKKLFGTVGSYGTNLLKRAPTPNVKKVGGAAKRISTTAGAPYRKVASGASVPTSMKSSLVDTGRRTVRTVGKVAPYIAGAGAVAGAAYGGSVLYDKARQNIVKTDVQRRTATDIGMERDRIENQKDYYDNIIDYYQDLFNLIGQGQGDGYPTVIPVGGEGGFPSAEPYPAAMPAGEETGGFPIGAVALVGAAGLGAYLLLKKKKKKSSTKK